MSMNESSPDSYDLIIIGGGPAGSTAAIYAVRARLRTLVLDKGAGTGALGMAGHIANYPGFPEPIAGGELLARMRQQAEGLGAEFVQEKVLTVELSGEQKAVFTTQAVYYARAVIIATGSMGRAVVIPGEEELVGRGVSYCATCDGAFFREQAVAVAGNNDEALEEALFLTRFVSALHLLVPTSELRAEPALAAEIAANPKVQVHYSARLEEIIGTEQVEAVRFTRRGAEAQTLAVSGVFVYLQGNKPVIDFLGGQLPASEEGCLLVDEMMQTPVSGVFAVGDVCCHHVKQVVIAAAEGATAAMAAVRQLSGRDRLRADWS